MECFSGEDKLRLLLIAALSCNSASTTSSGGGGGANGGGGGGVSASGSYIAFNLANTDLDRYGEQLKAANPDLDISAIRYVHQLRWPLAPVLNEFVFLFHSHQSKKFAQVSNCLYRYTVAHWLTYPRVRGISFWNTTVYLGWMNGSKLTHRQTRKAKEL